MASLSRSHLFVSTYEVTSKWRWHDAQQSAHRASKSQPCTVFADAIWEREKETGDAGSPSRSKHGSHISGEKTCNRLGFRRFFHLRFLYGLTPLLPKLPSDIYAWQSELAW